MAVKREFWWLPRPSKSRYPGSFPLYFEKKLLDLIKIDPDSSKIIHIFGGKPEYGETVDINPENNPTYIGDAHDLNFLPDNSYNVVICDPPYSQTRVLGHIRHQEKAQKKQMDGRCVQDNEEWWLPGLVSSITITTTRQI